jgi:[protein-PII] uridylyltransferase
MKPILPEEKEEKRMNPTDFSEQEVDQHFRLLPDHYRNVVDDESLLIHLEMGRESLREKACGNASTAPLARWRHASRDTSRVSIMGVDRCGVLAKIAGVFCISGLNILEADVFTRTDGFFLDVFRVEDKDHEFSSNPANLNHFQTTLVRVLSQNPDLPFEFLSEEPTLPRTTGRSSHGTLVLQPLIEFIEGSSKLVILRIQTWDYLGILHDILQVIALSDFNVSQARIQTASGVIDDEFHLTDRQGKSVRDPGRMATLRHDLLKMLLEPPLASEFPSPSTFSKVLE